MSVVTTLSFQENAWQHRREAARAGILRGVQETPGLDNESRRAEPHVLTCTIISYRQKRCASREDREIPWEELPSGDAYCSPLLVEDRSLQQND